MSIYQVVTIDSVDYDSFESLADADSYLAADPNAEPWRALGSDAAGVNAKGRFLVGATRVLARQLWRDGVIVDPLPQALQEATAELASAMAGGYDAANQQSTASGLKRQKAGSVEQEFFWSQSIGVGLRFPLPVWELIRDLLASADSSGIGSSLSTGTCGQPISQIDYGYGPGYGIEDDNYRRVCD